MNKDFTLVEMLCTIVIILLISALWSPACSWESGATTAPFPIPRPRSSAPP